MVLRHRDCKMASEQPVTKKIRIGDRAEDTDEPDFIHTASENGVRTNLSALHLSRPANVNEDDITLNAVNLQLHALLPAEGNCESDRTCTQGSLNGRQGEGNGCAHPHSSNDTIEPAPDISAFSRHVYVVSNDNRATNHDRSNNTKVTHITHDSIMAFERNSQQIPESEEVSNNERLSALENYSSHVRNQAAADDSVLELENFDDFQRHLVKQCLCMASEHMLRRSFEGQQITDYDRTRTAALCEWPTPAVLQFLSNLQLLFDVYLKQNTKGYICSRISDICDALVRNEHCLVEQIISLCDTRNKYVSYLSARVLSSFLIIAKVDVNRQWLDTIVRFLIMEHTDYGKLNFALEVIKRVVEWKDIDSHVLDDTQLVDAAGPSSRQAGEPATNCTTVQFVDPESYDTSSIKNLIITSLVTKWPDLIGKIQSLIISNNSVESQTCILTFLALWESTISVKANLSVIDTKPFHTHLVAFVTLLYTGTLSPLVWKQLLSLFNEVLCYGSTLALQDMLPEDTCRVAHLVVRYVKDCRLLDRLPYRRNDGFTVNSFVGTVPSTQALQPNTDKTLLQKMVLLVLKSVAVTIKETRSDSSDSSVSSDDTDFNQDMQMIERSIRDVLKKVDLFIKNSLDFHPQTSFCKILVHLFSDQDDYMIEAMVCALDITVGISYHNAVFPDLISMLNPVHSFIEFLKIVAHEPGVLLDYLVSNETCFLLYLLRFLKYISKNWQILVNSCYEMSGNELDNTMTVLIRLKMQISRLVDKQLFPYNINPVLRLLRSCESRYEGNDLS